MRGRLSIVGLVAASGLVGCVRKKPPDQQPSAVVSPVPETAPVVSDDQRARILLSQAQQSLQTTRDINDALSPVQLATVGLNLAPPNGEVSVPVVVGLLAVRAQASIQYGELPSALTDLKAARQWLPGAKEHSSYLLALVALSEARLLHAKGKSQAAIAHSAGARGVAAQVGAPASLLECEAYVFEGEAERQLTEDGEEGEPQAKYFGVYEVAKRYGYPKELWDITFDTLTHLGELDDDEAKRLMGSVPFGTTDLQGTAPSAEVGAAATATDPVASSDAVSMVARLQPRFQDCYQKALRKEPAMPSGRALLTLDLRPEGTVLRTRGRRLGLSDLMLDCVSARAMEARFDPPQDSSSFTIPLTFGRD